MKFIKVTRSDFPGSYIQPPDKIADAMQGEFDCIEDMVVGESFTLSVVEMEPAECEKLPEFQGW